MPELPGKQPIRPKKHEVPVVPVERWTIKGDDKQALVKTFKFRRNNDRTRFVTDILRYEEKVQHPAHITIHEDTVTIKLTTQNIDKPTELDKEYASFCDITFKDIVYEPDTIDIDDELELVR